MVLNEADLEPADQVLPWEGACSACPCWCTGEWDGTGRLWMLRRSWWGWWSAWEDTKCWPNGTDTCRTQQKIKIIHKWDLRLSQQWWWRFKPYKMWQCGTGQVMKVFQMIIAPSSSGSRRTRTFTERQHKQVFNHSCRCIRGSKREN